VDTWKKFEQNSITHSAAHHLMAIDSLMKQYGYARVSDVARYLEITRGSVSLTIKSLKSQHLVIQDEHRFLHLSAEGQQIADTIRARHALIARFLTDVLGVADEQADIDACKVEHLLSGQTSQRLINVLRFTASGVREASGFIRALGDYETVCDENVEACPYCESECLSRLASRPITDLMPNPESKLDSK